MNDTLIEYNLWKGKNPINVYETDYGEIGNQYGRDQVVCREFFQDHLGYSVVDVAQCHYPHDSYDVPKLISRHLEELSDTTLSILSNKPGHPDQIHFRVLGSCIDEVYYVECKRKNGDLNPKQIEWIKRFKDIVPIKVVYLNPINGKGEGNKVEKLFMEDREG